MDDLPELTSVIYENDQVVNAIHILGSCILVYLTVIAWYHSSPFILNKENNNIEQYNRKIMLLNMALMCFVFSTLSISRQLSIGRYYTRYGLKKWYQVDYNDWPSFNLYLFLFAIMLVCVHHSINCVRIFYELQHSTYGIRHYFSFILISHCILYFIISFISSCNPFILMASIMMIDYTEHMIITVIYCTRVCCRRDGHFQRNLWGIIGEVAHMVSILPISYERSMLSYEQQTSQTEAIAFITMYFLGYLMMLGWYKFFMLTPTQFVTETKDNDDNQGSELERVNINQ